MRVAVVARAVMPLHGVGGLERSVRDLVRHLAARGVEVTLITPPPFGFRRTTGSDPFASPRIRVRHVRYIALPFGSRRGLRILDRSIAYPVFGLRAGRAALALVNRGEVDVVHGFGASVLGYALAHGPVRRRARRNHAARSTRAGAPLVFNPQGLEEFGATARRQQILKRIGYTPLQLAVRCCARAADCILATDRSLEPMVQRHLRPEPDQMRTIPNGIDLAEAGALAGPAQGAIIRRRHGIAPGETVLLSVGRLEHNKGFDVLAAALARASRARAAFGVAGWRWVIVGGGPFRREIETAIDEHGLGPHVVFAGRASDADLHGWYEAASLFVHPTRYEGSSLVTLEAMAHRKPVIATVAGGLPDKVRPGVNGWLVEPGDVDSLRDAIDQAASNLEALPAMGDRSREIVETEFNWPVLADRQIALYEELLGSGLA